MQIDISLACLLHAKRYWKNVGVETLRKSVKVGTQSTFETSVSADYRYNFRTGLAQTVCAIVHSDEPKLIDTHCGIISEICSWFATSLIIRESFRKFRCAVRPNSVSRDDSSLWKVMLYLLRVLQVSPLCIFEQSTLESPPVLLANAL